jgi:hypothetical protein
MQIIMRVYVSVISTESTNDAKKISRTSPRQLLIKTFFFLLVVFLQATDPSTVFPTTQQQQKERKKSLSTYFYLLKIRKKSCMYVKWIYDVFVPPNHRTTCILNEKSVFKK